MKNLLLAFSATVVLFSCNQKDKQSGSKKPGKKNENSGYIISKDGIGDLKIGMTQQELEKMLNQKLVMKHGNDTGDVWADTATVNYKEMEVTLFFERQYNEEPSPRIMQLAAIQTGSPLCKTETGLGIGDVKADIIAAYDENPIDMGPQYEQVNDSTWSPSKTKYNINVKDDKWDRELIFHLVNKKVASLGASIIMGE